MAQRIWFVDNAHIAEYTIRLADDALITAQRLCEWSARAPTLEEDLALANVGLDFLGRARMCYAYAGELLGKSEDELAYLRDSREFRNALIFELPKGDFAFTMVRQYLVDEFDLRYFAHLAESTDPQLAAIALKTLKEVDYHQRRSLTWMKRLGQGSVESNTRMQAALDELWGYVAELFIMDAVDDSLLQSGIGVNKTAIETDWRRSVEHTIVSVNTQLPMSDWQVSGGRNGMHTEHLGLLLTEMQYLQRAYPGASW